jgi:hypothetical protein
MLHVVASRGVLCVVGVEAFAMMVPEATATIVHIFYGDASNYSLELPVV